MNNKQSMPQTRWTSDWFYCVVYSAVIMSSVKIGTIYSNGKGRPIGPQSVSNRPMCISNMLRQGPHYLWWIKATYLNKLNHTTHDVCTTAARIGHAVWKTALSMRSKFEYADNYNYRQLQVWIRRCLCKNVFEGPHHTFVFSEAFMSKLYYIFISLMRVCTLYPTACFRVS